MSFHVLTEIQKLLSMNRVRTRGIASGAASTSQTDAIIAECVVPRLQEVFLDRLGARRMKSWVEF